MADAAPAELLSSVWPRAMAHGGASGGMRWRACRAKRVQRRGSLGSRITSAPRTVHDGHDMYTTALRPTLYFLHSAVRVTLHFSTLASCSHARLSLDSGSLLRRSFRRLARSRHLVPAQPCKQLPYARWQFRSAFVYFRTTSKLMNRPPSARRNRDTRCSPSPVDGVSTPPLCCPPWCPSRLRQRPVSASIFAVAP